jgi:amino acid transporter
MLQFFQRHEINKMHKTPIVSLVFTFLFSLFFTWAAFATLPQANAKRQMQMQSGFTRYI